MVKVLSVFGTRPETIKMAPLLKELERRSEIESIVCVTGQHREMLDQVLKAFAIHPDYDLHIMKQGQTLSGITQAILEKLDRVLAQTAPDMLLVHGDTTSAFAGALCGRRYEKEMETHFRDCLLFYLDGRIRFERYCYGEAACLVFSVWAHGFDAQGKILWDKEPEFESQRSALPRVLTDVQEAGTALQFDGLRKRYVMTEEFASDKPNGYGKWKVFWLQHCKKG